jgi:alpha-beta hydrolase superfamily lysophospholipase
MENRSPVSISENSGSTADPTLRTIQEQLTEEVRRMTVNSPRLTSFAGTAEDVDAMLNAIEDVWIEVDGVSIHIDRHRCDDPKAVIVFQPGSGAHARVYFQMAGLLTRRGYEVWAIDRPGHGLSGGTRGHCTVDQAIAVSDAALSAARSRMNRPVVLMGSSMGGLLTVFGLLRGLRPDLAVAHNFVYPGKLISLRMRARWIRRFRTRPYPLTELVHGFEKLSSDPSVADYLKRRTDPGAAWELSAESVASMFDFITPKPERAPETLVITGNRDSAIPGWATRFFMWWSGLPHYEVVVIEGAGHLLFHDHLDRSIPVIADWLDARLP